MKTTQKYLDLTLKYAVVGIKTKNKIHYENGFSLPIKYSLNIYLQIVFNLCNCRKLFLVL